MKAILYISIILQVVLLYFSYNHEQYTFNKEYTVGSLHSPHESDFQQE